MELVPDRAKDMVTVKVREKVKVTDIVAVVAAGEPDRSKDAEDRAGAAVSFTNY
ncbi:hypothetical protein L7E55_15965 [Pelotomaculum isophthalicicum JI]|uniref:Uncharacterized protein n=1 Tax=Pelotomaculum isophthalicicum JI TaxID=947010 RepID=A0A9X4H3S3_9FIRM|nr:hypothetical protein [Pelotomaculum isophthalicicum]MDF9409825.1 hypothetical protein [Pelotomaculum isophthalicicum JI]